jgi:hypothetical protein
MNRKHLYGFLLLALSIACKGESPAERLSSELQPVTSWAATIHMVSETWMSDAVPTAYALKTLQTAQRELKEESDALAQASTIPADQRATAQEHLENLNRISGEMSESMQRSDRARVAQAVNQISAEEEAIKALARSGGPKP